MDSWRRAGSNGGPRFGVFSAETNVVSYSDWTVKKWTIDVDSLEIEGQSSKVLGSMFTYLVAEQRDTGRTRTYTRIVLSTTDPFYH